MNKETIALAAVALAKLPADVIAEVLDSRGISVLSTGYIVSDGKVAEIQNSIFAENGEPLNNNPQLIHRILLDANPDDAEETIAAIAREAEAAGIEI